MVDNIKLIKFTDGEEVVANVISNLNGVEFDNAMRIVILPPSKEDPKPTIAFAAFLPYVKGKMSVKPEHVFLVADVDDSIVEQWKQVFGKATKIWMPTKPANDPLAAVRAAATADPLAATKSGVILGAS